VPTLATTCHAVPVDTRVRDSPAASNVAEVVRVFTVRNLDVTTTLFVPVPTWISVFCVPAGAIARVHAIAPAELLRGVAPKGLRAWLDDTTAVGPDERRPTSLITFLDCDISKRIVCYSSMQEKRFRINKFN
jgi:hypothetical protein